MSKTITLRLSDESYAKLSLAAREENRSLANLIETLALGKLEEDLFADDFEMSEIFTNDRLLKKLEKGHLQARERKGRFVA
ncbi:MAG: CopG family transcriptional regulator [Nitrospirae bacterium]|nr:CopG family transcriptional regulator [Nitrospirota bacterium]